MTKPGNKKLSVPVHCVQSVESLKELKPEAKKNIQALSHFYQDCWYTFTTHQFTLYNIMQQFNIKKIEEDYNNSIFMCSNKSNFPAQKKKKKRKERGGGAVIGQFNLIYHILFGL